MMSIRHDTDGSLLPVVNATRRALVFLTVGWSGPERTARQSFRIAAERLASDDRDLGVECFVLDEDSEWCQVWLHAIGIPQLGSGYPLGAGSILWLESGRAVSHEIGGCSLKPKAIEARTHWLWGQNVEPAT
jgi:hypothetical protein